MRTITCRVCGRPLTAWVSMVRGVGPVCWSRIPPAFREGRLDEWLNLDSGEEYHEHYEVEDELCNLTGEDCTGDPVFCEECPTMVPEMEEEEAEE